MKISVIIPSRDRPYHLMAAVRELHRLASGRHQVAYVIGWDDDDRDTGEAVTVLGLEPADIVSYCTPRLGSLGQMVNNMAAFEPADVYCSLCDDVKVLTPGWDEIIHRHWRARPDWLWWWRTLAHRPATYAIVSHKWYEAAGNRIFSSHFPFWWDDVWTLQVWWLASGKVPQAVDAFLDDRAFATHRMRDLREWADYYTFLKPERLEQAERIARNLGWPWPATDESPLPIGDVREEFLRAADAIQAAQGDRSPPTPEYVEALERARRRMRAA